MRRTRRMSLLRKEIRDRPAQEDFDWKALVFVLVGWLFPRKGIAVHPADGSNDFDPGAVRREEITGCYVQLGAAANFAGKLMKRRVKPILPEMHARQPQLIEFTSQRLRIDERRA